MKAIILARVSMEEQLEGQSLPAQTAKARNYVAIRNFEIKSEYQFDESSTKDQRKKFEKVIQEIKKSKEPIALIVDCIDRLQRSFKESVILDEFRKAGKLELHFIRENLVISKDSNSSDILRWDMGVMFAKSYVLQLSDNVKRSFEQMRQSGLWTGKPPLGYIRDENNIVILDPKKAPLIIKAFERYASGQFSLETLVKSLSEDGLKGSNGGKLYIGSIHKLLQNPFYYGVMRSKGKLYPHKYEHLIEKPLFDKVQEELAGHNKRPFKYASIPTIFRGLIHCAHCGRTITAERKKEIYIYYHCTAYKTHCKKVFVRQEDLVSQIADKLKKMKLTPEKIQIINERLKKSHEYKNAYYNGIVENLQSENIKIEKMINFLFDERAAGSITTEYYDKKLIEYKQKQEDIIQQLADHNQADKNFYINASTVLELADRAYELFISSKDARKRQLLGFLLQNCELEDKKLNFDLKTPFEVVLANVDNPSVYRGGDSNSQAF